MKAWKRSPTWRSCGSKLGFTSVTDKGMDHIKALKSLEYLDLYKTNVTSRRGLGGESGTLKKLTVSLSKEVKEEALDDLEKIYPRLKIER